MEKKYCSIFHSAICLHCEVIVGARENLQRIADRKQAEIAELRAQIERTTIYLQAIQDSIKALPREIVTHAETKEGVSFRPGSLLAKAQDAISQHGKPMYIGDLLISIGVENTKKARVSLVGSLGTYVRRKAVFTRPKPNTFGLIGMQQEGDFTKRAADGDQYHADGQESFSLPDDFGQ